MPPVVATIPDAMSSLSGLVQYTGLSPTLLNLFDAADALSQSTTAAANRAGVQLAPSSPATASRAAATQTFDVLDIVAAHSDSLRLAQADGTSGIATGEAPPTWGVWGQALGGHADQSEQEMVGYSANYGGLLFGVDQAINDSWRAGGVFSYSNAEVDATGDAAGNTTRVNSYGLIGYASYVARAWYANLSAGAVQQRYETMRLVDFTGFSGVADGGFSGTQYVARAEAGRPLALGSITVTPLASLAYSYLQQNGYTESGGNGAAVTLVSTHNKSVTSNIGMKFERAFDTSYGGIVPDLQLMWQHEYDNTRTLTQASYAAAPTGQTGFTTEGAAPVSDMAVLSLGATLLRANNLSLTVRYEFQAGSGFVSQAGSLRLRQLF